MKSRNKNADDPTLGGLDLKGLIHQRSLFFDKLIELIPAKFYLPADEDKPWIHGLSKAKRASAKKQSRENIKKARRDRLDPEKSSATTVDLLMQSLEKDKLNEEIDGDDEVDAQLKISGMEDEERKMTYEELQQRLHNKIEQFRASRTVTNFEKVEKRNEQRKKRKRDSEAKPVAGDGENRKVKKDVDEASKELAFSQVKLGDEERGKKKRKLSKEKELERARKLEEVMKDPSKGEMVVKKHLWNAATSRAAGIKVHDDPKLLKQSIHKEKKRHQKNAVKWKERVEGQKKTKAEKQKKRSDNLAERAREKKMRKIAKREKKLMRPGFEGRAA